MRIKVTDLIILVAFSALFLMLCHSAFPEDIDMSVIAQIESSNNPDAFNERTQAVGLYQITKICLKDYNNHHLDPRQQYSHKDMFHPDKAFVVADWYMNFMLTKYLKFYKIPITEENILIAWHDGIGNLRKYINGERVLGEEMKGFLRRYYEVRLLQ